MRQLMTEANAANKPLTLSTAKSNPARKLYKRPGFTEVGESQFKVYMERKPHAQ
jgi:ribosomal protein S18 acetylase RimI-like enzyme